jgi:ABC-type antimicrobial peptide transport system permease subunit
VGIPIGIVAGRATWTAIAHGVGVGSDPSVPWWLLGVMVLAIIFAVLVVAAIPARRAGRAHPAVALRSE